LNLLTISGESASRSIMPSATCKPTTVSAHAHMLRPVVRAYLKGGERIGAIASEEALLHECADEIELRVEVDHAGVHDEPGEQCHQVVGGSVHTARAWLLKKQGQSGWRPLNKAWPHMMRSESLGRLEAPCFLLLFLWRSVYAHMSSRSCVAGVVAKRLCYQNVATSWLIECRRKVRQSSLSYGVS